MGITATLNSAAVIAALGYTPSANTHNHSGVYVPVDVGAGGVGMPATMYNNGSGCASGGTIAGSSLQGAAGSGGSIGSDSVSRSGTWKNVSGNTVPNGYVGTFQRIA